MEVEYFGESIQVYNDRGWDVENAEAQQAAFRVVAKATGKADASVGAQATLAKLIRPAKLNNPKTLAVLAYQTTTTCLRRRFWSPNLQKNCFLLHFCHPKSKNLPPAALFTYPKNFKRFALVPLSPISNLHENV